MGFDLDTFLNEHDAEQLLSRVAIEEIETAHSCSFECVLTLDEAPVAIVRSDGSREPFQWVTPPGRRKARWQALKAELEDAATAFLWLDPDETGNGADIIVSALAEGKATNGLQAALRFRVLIGNEDKHLDREAS